MHQRDVITNIYAPNIKIPKYIRQALTGLKKNLQNNKQPHSRMHRTDRQMIYKEIENLKINTIDYLDITDICRTSHSTREYMLF